MQIRYKSRKLQRICESAEEARRVYNVKMAQVIQIRIAQIKSAQSINYLLEANIGGCHGLKGKREGQYAMKLVQPYRLIFTQENDNTVSIRIEEIVDYH